MGLTDQAGKVASNVADSMKGTPIILALLILFCGMLGFAAYLMGLGVGAAKERDKAQMELIGKLVTDIRDCRQGAK